VSSSLGEGAKLRQRWNWLRNSGSSITLLTEATSQMSTFSSRICSKSEKPKAKTNKSAPNPEVSIIIMADATALLNQLLRQVQAKDIDGGKITLTKLKVG